VGKKRKGRSVETRLKGKKKGKKEKKAVSSKRGKEGFSFPSQKKGGSFSRQGKKSIPPPLSWKGEKGKKETHLEKKGKKEEKPFHF